MNKKTLVIGASTNKERYSYLAINKLLQYKHTVVAVGIKQGNVGGVAIETSLIPFENIDTITLYVSAKNQIPYYDYIISLKPKRLIFNPGTENDELATLASKHNIEALEACTLVLLSTNHY